MQINSMLPVLLNILSGQAGQNKVDKSTSKQEMGEVFRQLVENPSETAVAAGIREAKESDLKQPTQQPAPQGSSLPDFLPLPLRSPLFDESRFFMKNNREEASGREDAAPCNVFVNLRTNSLGSLWIYLSAGKESLTVSFFTEEESFTSLINDSIPGLVEELQKQGYSTVKAAGITRPGIKCCSDIVPGSASTGHYLLDLEV